MLLTAYGRLESTDCVWALGKHRLLDWCVRCLLAAFYYFFSPPS
jgi:hypothetical protein